MSHSYWSLYKFAVAAVVCALLTACHHSANKETSDIAGIIPTVSGNEPMPAIEARYTQWPDPDTLLIYIDGTRYKVASNGNIFSPDGKKRLKIGSKGSIETLYFVQKGVSLIVFFTDVTDLGASNHAERIDIQTGKTLWSTDISGVAMVRPIIKGQFAYVASSGFVGKLKLKNGQYDWKHADLNTKGRFEKFQDISFPSKMEAVFVAPHSLSLESDTIIINDMTGDVLKMN